jgi:hypothetical protein
MTIHELRSMYPRTYQQIFNLGVQSERRKALAADLIAAAKPDPKPAAVFYLQIDSKCATGQIWAIGALQVGDFTAGLGRFFPL